MVEGIFLCRVMKEKSINVIIFCFHFVCIICNTFLTFLTFTFIAVSATEKNTTRVNSTFPRLSSEKKDRRNVTFNESMITTPAVKTRNKAVEPVEKGNGTISKTDRRMNE